MKKILLIEDGLDTQKIYSEKLKSEGYDVLVAANTSQGLQLAKDEKPNLILLDIMLPGEINGLELLEMLKKDNQVKNVPVIVLTNIDSEKENALNIGANDYLIKVNTNLDVLLEKVKKNI